jgi:hypothetical protein
VTLININCLEKKHLKMGNTASPHYIVKCFDKIIDPKGSEIYLLAIGEPDRPQS